MSATQALMNTIVSVCPELSSREASVVQLIVEGWTYAEIGSALVISPRTVKLYALRAREKLACKTNGEVRRLVIGALVMSQRVSCPN